MNKKEGAVKAGIKKEDKNTVLDKERYLRFCSNVPS